MITKVQRVILLIAASLLGIFVLRASYSSGLGFYFPSRDPLWFFVSLFLIAVLVVAALFPIRKS